MIKQNTKEWYEERHKRIGASDCNVIMGVSKYGSWDELLDTKCKPLKIKPPNYIQQMGHDLEEGARCYYEIVTGCEWPSEFIVRDHLCASLDGYSGYHTWECKYVGRDDFEIVNSGYHLDQYYPQIQMQMYLSESPKCHLFVAKQNKTKSYFRFDCTWTLVDFDSEYVHQKLLPAVEEFYGELRRASGPDQKV